MTTDGLSLDEVDGRWGAVPSDATALMRTVYELRRRPIGTLQPEDLRVLVGQQVGLDVLVPRTVTLLEQNPLLEGDYYPGDVLVSVLRLPSTYWSANPAQRTAVEAILTTLDHPDSSIRSAIRTFREATAV
ncbi:contact-dependent growth inhibition system immunity protein [Umezawaea endophytica]|uniref:Contact-dependent growth inhibition system immunity protein n=1 Tax=Umezawaea endophytica TaxID=1654476 RepID=A0A9X3AFD8_9PSEU|nr:contact-dependent growth inhibition system immunity protein [Umezawaea endophytica]MCS7478126.1 contact-dependent growth inhibition system immunity protein [Umezawaea endophytica]